MGDVPSRCFDTACLAFVRSRQGEARDCTHPTSFSTTLVMMIPSARAHALFRRTRWSPVEARVPRGCCGCCLFSALRIGNAWFSWTDSPRTRQTAANDRRRFRIGGRVARGLPDGSRRQLMALEAACRQAGWSYCVVGRPTVASGARGVEGKVGCWARSSSLIRWTGGLSGRVLDRTKPVGGSRPVGGRRAMLDIAADARLSPTWDGGFPRCRLSATFPESGRKRVCSLHVHTCIYTVFWMHQPIGMAPEDDQAATGPRCCGKHAPRYWACSERWGETLGSRPTLRPTTAGEHGSRTVLDVLSKEEREALPACKAFRTIPRSLQAFTEVNTGLQPAAGGKRGRGPYSIRTFHARVLLPTRQQHPGQATPLGREFEPSRRTPCRDGQGSWRTAIRAG